MKEKILGLFNSIQSMKMVLGIILMVWAKIDFYISAKATEAGTNNFILVVLGIVIAARVADKVVAKQENKNVSTTGS